MMTQQFDEVNSKILVIDDNESNVRLLQKILNINGFSGVRTLTDSRHAVSTYDEYQPDLMLLDLKMPYLDGFDILRHLKNEIQSECLPIIVITEQDDMDNRI